MAMCEMCHGTSEIVRPTEHVLTTVQTSSIMNNRVYYDDEDVVQIIGGIDACPQCAKWAEFNYKELKRRR